MDNTTLTLEPVPFAYGLVAMESLDHIQRREAVQASAQEAAAQPVVQGLAAYVRACWEAAYTARRTTGIEERMLRCVRQRRGEYDPEVLQEIRKSGGSEIYMMLTSNKCRSAVGWLRDALLGAGEDKPWTIEPTPLPEMPPSVMEGVQQLAIQEAQQFIQATGQVPSPQNMLEIQSYVKDRVVAHAKQKAKEFCERMERKMEDQLIEGGFQQALADFLEDLVTFPSAFLVGPIVRNKKRLSWQPDATGNYSVQVKDELVYEWERCDPFMIYPAPHSTDIDDGYIIRRHRMTRQQLNELLGVEGYDDDSIKAVLNEFGKGGLHDWLMIDVQKATAEGKSAAAVMSNPEATIDALQFWGYVQGNMLIEWGMDEVQIPDPERDYSCEVWLIGPYVIKAQLNSDPLGRKPIFKASYEEIPGSFWGNGVADLCRDVQKQCNTAARAMANNMGIGSGPQVVYNVDRLPAGEDLTQMYPWKVWQTTSDPFGSSAPAVSFFAPPMISGELMQIYRFFSDLADEHTGIPRYLAGDATGSGALRTSSGMSMLMNNAGKGIKQVISNVDKVIKGAIERLWYYNMRYGTDPDLKGDIKVVVRGAEGLVIKETQQQRMNEFLQLALTNPIVNQIVGEEAIAALLRTAAKKLDVDSDDIVPPPEIIRARVYQQQQQAAATQKAMQDFQMRLALAPSQEVSVNRGPNGEVLGMTVVDKQPHMMTVAPGTQAPITPGAGMPGGATVPTRGPSTMSNPNQTTGGTPITDVFSPMRKA